MSRATTILAFALLLLALCIPARSAPLPRPAPNPIPAPAPAVDPIADALASKLAAISKQIGRRPILNPKAPRNPKFTGLRLTRKSNIAPVVEVLTAATTITAAPVLATDAALAKRWPPTEAPTGSGGAGVFTPIWGPVKIAPPKYDNPKWTKKSTSSVFAPSNIPVKVVPTGAVPANPKDTKSHSASTFKPTSGPVKIPRTSDPIKIWTGVNTAPTTHPGNPHPYPSQSK